MKEEEEEEEGKVGTGWTFSFSFFFSFFFVSLPAREKGRMTVEVLGLQSRLELNLPVCLCERAHDVYCSAGRAAVVYSWPRSRLVR